MLAVSTGKKPFPKNAVVITFDDGWKGNVEAVIPIAETFRVPVTIFISTEPVENGVFWWSYIWPGQQKKIITNPVEYFKNLPNEERLAVIKQIKEEVTLQREAMTVSQLQAISKQDMVTIGGHTISHPILSQCSEEQAFVELSESKQTIEKWIGKQINSFAYPNGSYGTREVEILRKLNYDIAYTTQQVPLTKERIKNTLELPRFIVIEKISNAEALCRMLGVWQSVLRQP
ncbi:polysaccharide deacetylase family protein [Mucilaginibacter antarcticus]|uniref:polysaccharide deacetylase family protein n=1 Tax=Mucilaginibacter antarcticus TaxID=1855725 RepID=UPI003642A8E4